MDEYSHEEHFDSYAIRWGEAINQLSLQLYRLNREGTENKIKVVSQKCFEMEYYPLEVDLVTVFILEW